MQVESAAPPADTLSIRLHSDQELVAAGGRPAERSGVLDGRTSSRSASPSTTQDLRGSHTLSAASTRQPSIDASSSSARFSWRLPPFHLFQRAPTLQIASSGDLSSRKLHSALTAPRPVDAAGVSLSDTLVTNGASSATFAHHLHNSRSTVLPPGHAASGSESGSYCESSLGTAELSSSLSAASYGTPAAAEAGRSIASGSLTDDEASGTCGHAVASPRSQGALHTADADLELAVQEEPTGEADEAVDAAFAPEAGGGPSCGSAPPGMLSQLSSVAGEAMVPVETASGRVVWWENPLGGNSASMQSGGGSTAEGGVSESPPQPAEPPPAGPSTAPAPQERSAGGTQHSSSRYSTARSAALARPPLPPAGAPVPAGEAAVQLQANLDSLLRTSMMHSSQLFGSGREPSGTQLLSAHLSSEDPVSAMEMRMQHHEPVSSAFPVEESEMFHRTEAARTSALPHSHPAGIPRGNPSVCTVELSQQRAGAAGATGDITTGITDPLQGIDVDMQHFAPTDELSQCIGADSSATLSGPVAQQAQHSGSSLPLAEPAGRASVVDDEDSLPLPPMMVVERQERRAPARSGRITQFQSKRRSRAAGKAGRPDKPPKVRAVGVAASDPAARTDEMASGSRELFASASSMLSVDTAPSAGLAPPQEAAVPAEGVPGALEVRASSAQQAGGALSSQESEGVSRGLDSLTGDLMHHSCTYSLSVANGSHTSLGGSSSLTGRSSGGVPGLEPGTPPRRERDAPGAQRVARQGISPLELVREGQPSLRERFAAAGSEGSDSGQPAEPAAAAGGPPQFRGLSIRREEDLPPTPSVPGAESRALTRELNNSASDSTLSAAGRRGDQAAPPASPSRLRFQKWPSKRVPQASAACDGVGGGSVEGSPYSSFSFETDVETDNTNTWWSSIIEAGREQDCAAHA